MKHYTTIEQSRKLVELGLNPLTADMCWVGDLINLTYNVIPSLHPYKQFNTSNKINRCALPCWSLGALLEVIPYNISRNKAVYRLTMRKYMSRYEFYHENFGSVSTIIANGESPIEAAYNMVVWLLENGHIKKGE